MYVSLYTFAANAGDVVFVGVLFIVRDVVTSAYRASVPLFCTFRYDLRDRSKSTGTGTPLHYTSVLLSYVPFICIHGPLGAGS